MTKKQLLTKKQIIWIASAVGVVAILLGVCLFFLTNNVIRDVPNTIFVQKVDEDFVLNTQYNSKYMYNFKIEQNIEGKYVTLAVVKSDKNWLNLSGRQLDFAVGNKFRFSSCFSTENDSGNGSFCTPIEWTAYATLPEVDYQSVHVNLIENLITWDAVKNATQYQLSFVAESGRTWQYVADTNQFSLLFLDGTHKLDAGEYDIFIIATSSDPNFHNSNAGKGFSGLRIVMQNEILSVEHEQGQFLVTCTQKASAFQIDIDGMIFELSHFAEPVIEGRHYVYDLSAISASFGGLDFAVNQVQIKALGSEYVLESEPFVVT